MAVILTVAAAVLPVLTPSRATISMIRAVVLGFCDVLSYVALIIDRYRQRCVVGGRVAVVQVGDCASAGPAQKIIDLRDRTAERDRSRSVAAGDRDTATASHDRDYPFANVHSCHGSAASFVNIRDAKPGAFYDKHAVHSASRRRGRTLRVRTGS